MRRFPAAVLVAGLLSVVALAPAPEAQQRRVVTIAAGSVDGVYYPISGAISRITSETKSLNIRATVVSSGGSIANVKLMRAGEADFALLQNDVAYYAYNGVGLEPFVGKPVKSLVGVFSVYPEAVHLIATHASGVKSVGDLKGKRIAFGPKGSATEQNALQVLAAHGVAERDLAGSVRRHGRRRVLLDRGRRARHQSCARLGKALADQRGGQRQRGARAEVSLLHDR
jgi:TRAP transporter TAXI family solute receptor